VRVAASGVGPWDALIREGESQVSPLPPITLGSDLSGVIEAVGPGVTEFKNGDKIYGSRIRSSAERMRSTHLLSRT
jgi:NADPH:quinone reductase-like Zn-dependent oxidoreductase